MTKGPPSDLTCPKCHGTLFDDAAGGLPHYRCRVGHAYSIESLEAEMSEALDEALWIAYRSLKEKAALERRLAETARGRGRRAVEERWTERAESTETRA